MLRDPQGQLDKAIVVSEEDVRSVDSRVRMVYNSVIRLRHSGETCKMHIFLYIFRYIFSVRYMLPSSSFWCTIVTYHKGGMKYAEQTTI